MHGRGCRGNGEPGSQCQGKSPESPVAAEPVTPTTTAQRQGHGTAGGSAPGRTRARQPGSAAVGAMAARSHPHRRRPHVHPASRARLRPPATPGDKADDLNAVMPGPHLVSSLLKRWTAGTLHYRLSRRHMPYYLDEFTFRFNRRNSKARGMLFYRLLQQAVDTEPHPLKELIRGGY